MERERLYERIDARVDAMIAAGVEDEVRRADAAGASPHGPLRRSDSGSFSAAIRRR